MSVAFAEPRAWPSRDADGRTNQKVRRDSREALADEPREFLTERQRRERITAFRKRATDVRIPGQRRGHVSKDTGEAYSAIAGDVLDYLMFFATQTGRVFPSYEQIAEKVGCAYRTAVRVIHQLKRGGWITWERRFIRKRTTGQSEPQVEQTSNLYRLYLPNAAQLLIRAWRARKPPSADATPQPSADEEALQDAEKRLQAHLNLNRLPWAKDEEDARLRRGAALQAQVDRLGAAVAARNSEESTAVDDPAPREFP